MHTGSSWLPGGTQTCCTGDVFCKQGVELGAGNSASCHPPLPFFFQWLQELWPRGVFAEVRSSLRNRIQPGRAPRVMQSTLLGGARLARLTQPVHTAPPAPPLRQAGLAAPGSVGKGMACPLGCQNSTQKAPPQVGAVLGAGVESDTTTLAVNLSNRGLGLPVAASGPGLEV